MHYRRDYTQGGTYFFTVVTFQRIRFFKNDNAVACLRHAFKEEMARRPFVIDAIVILPDHIHSVWTLPQEDADYSMRWRNIKRSFTKQVAVNERPAVFASRNIKANKQYGNGVFGNIGFVTNRISAIMLIIFITIPLNTVM